MIASRHPFTLETWHMVMPFSSAFLVPIPLLFLHLKKRIVAGLTAGALK